jgi:hypothetical protein
MNRRKPFFLIILTLLFAILALLLGCAHFGKPPEEIDNICQIFRQNRDWYRSAYRSSEKWSVSIPVLMAIVHQESKFKAKAKPPRTSCLCFLPGPRPSSAYGYAQAVDETWDKYKSATGTWGADRNNFADAIDFIGWYCNLSYSVCGIAQDDAYNLYLAYHEGHNGFRRGTYGKKKWLQRVAWKVQSRAKSYANQLASCEKEFEKPRPCCLWPF